jgi:hypothetical protein
MALEKSYLEQFNRMDGTEHVFYDRFMQDELENYFDAIIQDILCKQEA